MKITLITVAYNSADTLRDTIESVYKQTHLDIEYIVIDGMSNDNTVGLIKEYEPKFAGRMRWISEQDHGMYDAMNKGIILATGDVIGILNSDDFFTSDNVIEKIVTAFNSTGDVDGVYGDICFVKPECLSKIVRYYSAKWFNPSLFRFGFMPPHPSFYVRRNCYTDFGLYKTNYKISADYELLIRYLYVNKLKTHYLNFCVTTMRTGGDSTRNLKSNWILNKEIVRGCRENGIYTNILILVFKYFVKITGIIFTNRNKL